MSVLTIFKGNVSKAQYDALLKEIDWKSKRPPGAVLHAAAFDDAGQLHVADVWESAEAFDAFVNERLAPAFAKFEIGPPDVKVYPLYNLDTFQAIDEYTI